MADQRTVNIPPVPVTEETLLLAKSAPSQAPLASIVRLARSRRTMPGDQNQAFQGKEMPKQHIPT
jgi:hypothetical protein